jgi:hypothetical protein
MPSPTNRRKHYPLNQSPFYKLKTRRKLASLFNTMPKKLEKIAKNADKYYRVFPKCDAKGKSRTFEVPKPPLDRIHLRLFKLLKRIEPPSYLHSGVKGRSYITNARMHIGCSRMITLDIYKFYPSTLGWHVFEFFYDVMQCRRDVAWLLTSLCTYNNHVPTGSCISQFIAFFAHYNMFEEIHSIACSIDLTDTCYVDDISISGNKANRSTLYKVRGCLKKRGLRSPTKKEHVYDVGYPKSVTGSIVADDELRLPNRKHKKIHEETERLIQAEDTKEKLKLLETTLGRAIAGSQSDPTLKKRVVTLTQEKKRIESLLDI